MANELADRLDAYAETVLATGAASSMAVAVTDGERTLASRSYGAPDGAMFQFGSIGKSFTAIVALQLAEREPARPARAGHRRAAVVRRGRAHRADHGRTTC